MINIRLTRFATSRNGLIFLVSSFYWFLQLMLLDKQHYDIVHGNPLTNWNASEWLIGYQGGFVRRGLFGGLLLRFAGHGIDPYLVVTFLPTAAYLILSILWFSITIRAFARKAISSFYLFVFLLNPSALLFFVFGGNVYRKDVVFVALLVLSSCNLFSLLRTKLSPARTVLLTLSFAVVACVILGLHEGLFAFVATPIWLSIFLFWGRGTAYFSRVNVAKSFAVACSFFVGLFFALSLFFKGDQLAVAKICVSWSDYFPHDCSPDALHSLGAISPLMWDLKRQVSLSGLRVMFSPLAPLTVLMSLLYLSCSVALSGLLFGKNVWNHILPFFVFLLCQ